VDTRLAPCVAFVAANARVIRATIARAVLGADVPDATLGSIVLLPHQLDAVRRLRPILADLGGALLADVVGLGKTYVALALAREAHRPLIVLPAALRPTWRRALERTSLAVPLITMESLSRGCLASAQPDLVIVDEAHHFRTPHTRRYGALARLCADAQVLLLSATPVHNAAHDLESLVALFLGSQARALAPELIARVIVRRSEADATLAAPLPELRAVTWLRVPHDADLLELIAEVPPAVPAADGGDAGVLAVWSLVRQWASSRAALAAALRRRIARAIAMEASLEEGRLPSRRELDAWRLADDAVQLALPGLLVAPSPSSVSCAALHAAVVRHRAAIERLLSRLHLHADPDDARATLIAHVRRQHRGARVVAFSEYEATVSALFRRLAPSGGVAMLTARGARVSGGDLARQEVLERFAPLASGVHRPGAADDVTLLLATELLSEGVNLQDAEVVIHLDLPWNPARLEQRVGRVRRLGASRPVHVYALAPPAAAERLLDVERRLHDKMSAAARVIGVRGSVLPQLLGALPTSGSEPSDAELASWVRRTLGEWAAGCCADVDEPAASAVRAPVRGFVALVRHGAGRPELVCSTGGAATTDVRAVAECIRHGCGDEIAIDPDQFMEALAAVAAWIASRRLATVLGSGQALVAGTRRRLLRRISTLSGSLPRHERAAHSELIGRARVAALAPLGAHAERALERLAAADAADARWLRAVIDAAATSPHGGGTSSGTGAGDAHVQAIILLSPRASPASATPS
jgi:superfamily II DNA or RNA helicase